MFYGMLTMLLYAARVVNSTPLFDPPEDPNDPEPITPHRLIHDSRFLASWHSSYSK